MRATMLKMKVQLLTLFCYVGASGGSADSVTATATLTPPSEQSCKRWEFRCRSGDDSFLCLSPDRFCNGLVDCPDGSDEPSNCSRKSINRIISPIDRDHRLNFPIFIIPVSIIQVCVVSVATRPWLMDFRRSNFSLWSMGLFPPFSPLSSLQQDVLRGSREDLWSGSPQTQREFPPLSLLSQFHGCREEYGGTGAGQHLILNLKSDFKQDEFIFIVISNRMNLFSLTTPSDHFRVLFRWDFRILHFRWMSRWSRLHRGVGQT